jgi:Arc/MetJ-type ribon-helix-helix transcriptional regulator
MAKRGPKTSYTTKGISIKFYITKEMNRGLTELAKSEYRSRADMIRILIRKALDAN